MSAPVGESLLAWARASLDEDAVREMIEPAVADLRYELDRAPAGRRAAMRRRGLWDLCRTVVAAVLWSWRRRFLAQRWAILLAPCALLAVGCAGMALLRGSYPPIQIVWGALGLVVAALVASWPLPGPRRAAMGALLAILALVPLVGVDDGSGIVRWLELPRSSQQGFALRLDAANLFTPLFVAAVASAPPRWAGRFAIAATALLAFQPHPEMAAIWSAVALVVIRRDRWIVAPALAACVAGNWLGMPRSLTGYGWDGMPMRLALHAPLAFALALGLFVGTAAWAVARARRIEGGERRALADGAATALAVQPAVAFAVDHTAPFLSYGGSYVIGYFGCLGLPLAAERPRLRVA